MSPKERDRGSAAKKGLRANSEVKRAWPDDEQSQAGMEEFDEERMGVAPKE